MLKIATGQTFYILEEPATGLHFEDVKMLLDMLHKLVERGNPVLVIEHNLDVIKTADWINDGPEGGPVGGRIVAEGPPEEVATITEPFTGPFLTPMLNGRVTVDAGDSGADVDRRAYLRRLIDHAAAADCGGGARRGDSREPLSVSLHPVIPPMPRQRPQRSADDGRPAGRSPSRKEIAAQVRRLPAPLRVVRAAELLFFPTVAFMLLGLPVPSNSAEAVATAFLAVEAIAAVAVAVGLGRRRRWAWVLAMVLAAWVIIGIVLRGPALVRAAFATPILALKLSLVLLAWTFLTQLVALVGCLSIRNRGEVLR